MNRDLLTIVSERVRPWEHIDTFSDVGDAMDFAEIGCCGVDGVKVEIIGNNFFVFIWERED